MSRVSCRVIAALFGILVPAGVAAAQAKKPVPQPRPDPRVQSGLGIHAHGGLGLHGSGGLIDDACDVIGLYGLQEFGTSSCAGSGGRKLFTLGGFLSYTKPFGTTRVQFQGGYHFTPQNEIRLEADGALTDFSADFSLTSGFRYTGQAFYGGAGVEFGDVYVGGTAGFVRYSGEEFIAARLRFDNVVYDEVDQERLKSGMSPLFGLRAMYSFQPGIRAYVDWYSYGLGDYYDSLEGAGTPLPLPMPVPLELPVRDRVFAFGVAIDVYSFFK